MSLLQPRLDAASLASVPDTFSSWDNCMSKAYCKWPIIIGIVIGALIALSLIWCCARCLCCGLECCCGICACCNACCPSPRRREKGYEQAPPTPYQNQYQYQQPPPMNPYFASGGAGGYRGANVAHTATFDAPSKSHRVNEDALPAMPSWSNATSRQVEQPHEQEDVEMERMPRVASPVSPLEQEQQAMLGQSNDNQGHDRFYAQPAASQSATLQGPMRGDHAQPYHDYSAPQQFSPGPYSSTNAVPAAHGNHFGSDVRTASPHSSQDNNYSNGQVTGVVPTAQTWHQSSGPFANDGRTSPLSFAATDGEFYEPRQRQQPPAIYTQQTHSAQQVPLHQPASYAQPKPYESSVPPSYRTQPPRDIVSPLSPPPILTPGGGNFGRKPVGGSWTNV